MATSSTMDHSDSSNSNQDMSRIDMDDVGSCQFACGSFVMELLKGKGFFTSGQTIHGRITLVLRVNVFVRGVWVKFTAVNTTRTSIDQQQQHQQGGEEANQIKVDLLANEDDHHCGGLHNVLVGLGEEVDSNDDHLLRLRAGTYTWPFSFTIPKHCPMSYCDDNVEVLYTLTGMLDTPALPAAMTQIVHHLIVDSIPTDIADAIAIPTNVLTRSDDETSTESTSMTVFESRSAFCSYNMCDSQPLSMTVKLVEGDSVFDFKKQASLIKLKCNVNNVKLKKKQKISITAKMFVEVKSAVRLDSKGACKRYAHHKHRLWEGSFELTEEAASNHKGEIEIPIKINPNPRRKCLKEWPRPTSIRHKEGGCILNSTMSGPLFSYKVLLLLTPSIANNNREPSAVCNPHILEIFIRPNALELGTTVVVEPAAATTVTDNVGGHQVESSNSSHAVVSTPQAVLAIPKAINAEAVSFGPAAILRDRTNRNQQPFRTPSNFAQLYEVVQQPVVVVNSTPQYSPTMAHIYQTPRVQQRDQQNDEHEDANVNDENDENDENVNTNTSVDGSSLEVAIDQSPNSPNCGSTFSMSVRTPSAILGMSRRGIAETLSYEGEFGLTLRNRDGHDDVDDIFHQPYIGRLSFAQ